MDFVLVELAAKRSISHYIAEVVYDFVWMWAANWVLQAAGRHL